MPVRDIISFALLALFARSTATLAQASGQVGLPIIFVHGICDKADSFLPIENAIKVTLQNQYRTLYVSSLDYVAFYDGANVWFQVPSSEETSGVPNTPLKRVDPGTRFFLVELYDTGQTSYDKFNPDVVAQIPIYTKGNELANVIWKIKAITGAPRVIVIGHSMGGLDARAYIEGLASPTGSTDAAIPYFNDIAALVTLDTPHGGTDAGNWNLGGGWLGSSCAANVSIDKAEMAPNGTDPETGVASIIPQMNYQELNDPTVFKPAVLPAALTITSVSSYWGGFVGGLLTFPFTDTVLGSSTQDLAGNLNKVEDDSDSSLLSNPNEFDEVFSTYGSLIQMCGITTPLHFLTCAGSSPQTFSLIEDAVLPSAVATSGQVQITLTNALVAAGSSVPLNSSTGSSTIWSILEGKRGGSITPTSGANINYKAPANHSSSTETFHIVAIDRLNPSQFAMVPIQVSSSSAKASTTTVLTPSATQILVGAGLTLNATVQGSGGTPTGTVTFYDSGKALSPELLNNTGVGIYTTTLPLGFHSITAEYSGDSNYAASSTASSLTVAVVAVDPQLSISPKTGVLGVTNFVKTDSGFTPYGLITHTATLPGGNTSVLLTYAAGDGTYTYSRTYSTGGSYSQIDTDGASGQSTSPATWMVTAPVANDFSLAISPTSQSVTQSGSVSLNVATTTTSGADQGVGLAISNVPSGLSASFSPTIVTPGVQSTLTVNASSSAQTGTYTLTITGIGSSATHTYQISVTVTQAQTGPTANLSPSIVRFDPQSVGTISSPQTITLMNTGSGQLVVNYIALAAGSDYLLNLPAGSFPLILNPLVPYTMQVSSEPTATGNRPGQILMNDNAPNSPQVVTLTGTGTPAQPTMSTINVNATLNGIALPGSYFYNYSLTGAASYSGSDAYSFSVQPGMYSIAFEGVPSYLTLSSVTPATTQSVAAGSSITFTLNFSAGNDFLGPVFGTPEGSTTSVEIIPDGASATFPLILANAQNGGASTPITLSVSGGPAGLTPAFDPQPVYTGQSATLTFDTTVGSTLPGIYALNLIGTNSSGLSHPGGNTSSLAITTPPSVPVQLVSISSSGVQANALSGISTPSAVSGDGRYVLFDSNANNLVLSGSGGLFVRDRQAGTTILASVSNSGTAADGFLGGSSISSNGQYVVFASSADNLGLGSNATNNRSVYVRDIVNGKTEREDLASDGTPGNGDGYLVAITADGRFSVFVSNATTLVQGASGNQAYLHDRKTGRTILVSEGNDGSIANSGVSSVAVSADGRFVAFDSAATNLISQNTSGLTQTYLRDVVNGTTVIVSINRNGEAANARVWDSGGTAGPIAMSADGRYIVFNTTATNLVSEPLDGSGLHLFMRDMKSQQSILVDTDSSGIPLGGWSAFKFPGISADGRFVSFDGFEQVVVRDTVAQQTQVVSLAPDGTAGNNSSETSYAETAVSSGGSAIVFVSSASNLVPSDINGVTDVFLAQNPFVGLSQVQSLVLSSPTASGGGTVSGTVSLSGAAPVGGATVAVWSNNAVAQPPAIVVVPAGATSVPITFSTSLVSAETIMTILASYNGGTGVAVLTLEPAPELAVSPTAWDSGYQAVGTSSAVQTFALTNSGTAALTINSVQLASGQAFHISSNTCGSGIAAGSSCSVSVFFMPSVPGSASDVLQVRYGSPATTQSISLTGDGATPVATISPAPLNFGSQLMPGSAAAVATLTNSGNAILANISASISGTNAADFAISADGCSGVTLPANSSCSVTIAFSPKAKGSRLATLSIADSATGSPQVATLTGTGVQSVPVVIWRPSVAAIGYGSGLGSGVLDATANANGKSLAGTFLYTSTISDGTPQRVTQSTVLAVGTYTLSTVFTPTDATDYATASQAISFTVKKITTTAAVTSSLNPSTYGKWITFTATVAASSGPTPTGTVTFEKNGTSIGTGTLSGGKAILSTSALVVGTHIITAVYGGNTDYLPSTSTGVSEITTASKTTTTLASSLNPSILGQSVTLTATVKSSTGGIPAGAVEFMDGTAQLHSVSLNSSGVATFSTSSLAVGSHSITAIYEGSTSFLASNSSVLTQTVRRGVTTTTIVASANPSQYLQTITFTCIVSSTLGTPTGTVTFEKNGTSIGTGTLSGGKAILSTSALVVGTHIITAVYGGNTDYLPSTSTGVSEITTASKTTTTLASSLNPSILGQSATLTATVKSSTGGIPTGAVEFMDGTTLLHSVTLNSSGVAMFSTFSLIVGRHSITVIYEGGANYVASTSAALTQNVVTATTKNSVALSSSPFTWDRKVPFTVTSTATSRGGTSTEAVEFLDAATVLRASFELSRKGGTGTASLTSGSPSITAINRSNTTNVPNTAAVHTRP